jgi:hypothetical protein
MFLESERHGHRPGAEKRSGNAEREARETRSYEERLAIILVRSRPWFALGFAGELSLVSCLTESIRVKLVWWCVRVFFENSIVCR